ncbi:tannase/feruloyl esterase family alpha/beta hydrolase [Streptomyces winkii]|uniref:tannase/feruloyl esterase family alpha/beta hydrolase n=1 Tax=Streptomyces winkii TaxID=3051178 RepID=UPI0028D632EA|nr:tannase/feruloyl esterase family alpha/beta hydrolase [Streptomyces sp. DSM 40971]
MKRASSAAVRPYRFATVAALSAALLSFPTPGSAAAPQQDADRSCARTETPHVPGAAHQEAACLDELTTAGTVASGHTDPADWAGLTPEKLPTPSGVPGVQIDGYFPDTSATNTNHGWGHDAQFVLRLPARWNGGLVVTGSPGNREQYANDRAIGDWALARGYAFAATDKGNTGAAFYRDGRTPGDALSEWNQRVTQLTRAARATVAGHYGRAPSRTLATGMSNGGYLVRWQLENHPELYDGGVDWEGTLWRAGGRSPNLLTFLPRALRHYPAYAEGGPDAEKAAKAMYDAGFPKGSEFLWPYFHKNYWDLTQRVYREEMDPDFDGATEAGTPFCAPGDPDGPPCDADYEYGDRPDEVRRAAAKAGLTGRIGKPLITLHGTLDTLLPIGEDSDVYARMVHDSGRGKLFRYYRVEDGNHVDSLADTFPARLRPLTPCHRSAFTALERWLDDGRQPPRSHTVHRPDGASQAELTNDCPLGRGSH